MIGRLNKILTAEMREIIARLGRLTDAPLYLVGGPVRDLVMNRKILDLDMAVEADPADLGARLAADLHGTVLVHPRFHTCKITTPAGTVVDLAQTRRESYPEPARLPVVEPGASIADDLARRDFSIQAMAMRLNGSDAGQIVDPFQGRRDIDRRLIRILHPNSFRDDPVRAFRAARYSARFGFRLERQTAAALRDLTRRPEWLRIASDRVMDEWHRAFEEEKWIAALRALGRMGLLAWLGIRWPVDLKALRRMDGSFKTVRTWYDPPTPFPLWASRFVAFLSLVPAPVRLRIGRSLPFSKIIKKPFQAAVDAARLATTLNADLRPSRIVDLLERVPPEWMPVLHARAAGRARRHIQRYIYIWRGARPPVTGDDLRNWGVPPGPAYPRLLHRIRAAALDGRIRVP